MTQSFASGKTLYLAQKLTPGGTLTVTTNPGPSNGRLYFKNDFQTEWIDFTTVTPSGSNYILGGLTRDLDQTAIPTTSNSTGKTWLATQSCVLVAMHDQYIDRQQDNILPKAISFSGTTNPGITVSNLTTAQRTALTPSSGTIVYDTTIGQLYQYISGAWSAVAAGSTQPNASTTVAGKLQIPTSAEVTAGTSVGTTGAFLSPTNAQVAGAIQDLDYIDLGNIAGTDTYTASTTPALIAYNTRQIFFGAFTNTNTSTTPTLNIQSLGARTITSIDGTALQVGELRTGSTYMFVVGSTTVKIYEAPFADATKKGIVEMATDAEAIAGTDTTRYVNPKQLQAAGVVKTVITSDVTTTSTTLGDVTGLSSSLASGNTYSYEFNIVYAVSNTVNQTKWATKYNGTETFNIFTVFGGRVGAGGALNIGQGISDDDSSNVAAVNASGVNYLVTIKGTVKTTSASTLIARFANVAGADTITVKAGSSLVTTKLD